MAEDNSMLNPVNKSRLHEDIVRQIQRKIIQGILKKGERLPSERELALNLEVNRSTLREALKKLEVLGLIEIRHGDGIYIRNFKESGNIELIRELVYLDDFINLDVLKNILEIRRILAPEMAALAAVHRSDDELKQLDMAVTGRDVPVSERDITVHQVIAKACKNLLYLFILNFFNQIYRDFAFLYFSSQENAVFTEKFHRDVYSAIKNRDGDLARRIMHDVLVTTENKIYENYAKLAGGKEAG